MNNKEQMINQVTVPMFAFNIDGSIKPNTLFHRSWDKLHSRCIEYPFAASQIGKSKKILDVGTAKSDIAWIKWLDNLPCEVYATDYDKLYIPVLSLKFFQSDVRKLPFDDNSFDKILAVSVIEHIGLEDSQTTDGIPDVSNNGDLDAINELKRVLKVGGELIMTFPFSFESFIFQKSARVYSLKNIVEINSIIAQKKIEYYEYQYSNFENLYEEYKDKDNGENVKTFTRLIKEKIFIKKLAKKIFTKATILPEHYGGVTWRRVSVEMTKATHNNHIDGILCGIWIKKDEL
jgi:ubiquinone/menaquinone biosynthesis C-methylase UbiE